MLNTNTGLMSSLSYMDVRQKSSILISTFAQEDCAYQSPSAQQNFSLCLCSTSGPLLCYTYKVIHKLKINRYFAYREVSAFCSKNYNDALQWSFLLHLLLGLLVQIPSFQTWKKYSFFKSVSPFYQDNHRLIHITSFLDMRQENCQLQ